MNLRVVAFGRGGRGVGGWLGVRGELRLGTGRGWM